MNTKLMNTKTIKSKLDKIIIKSYLLSSGDTLYDAYCGLNIGTDFEDTYGWPEEFLTSPVYKKYQVISHQLNDKLQNTDFDLTENDVDELENVWYNGSDAYDSVEEYENSMPQIYDSQIKLIKEIYQSHMRSRR